MIEGKTVTGTFFGRTTIDSIAYPPHLTVSNEKTPGLRKGLIIPGGAAHNAAATFAALGGKTNLVTKVGKNLEGSIVHYDVKTLGIDLIDCMNDRHFDVPVSNVAILPNGERHIITSPHHVRTDFDFPSNDVKAALQVSDICLFDTRYPSITHLGAEMARDNNIPSVLDAGNWQDRLDQLIPFIDIAICSDDFLPPGTETDQDVYEYMTGKGVKHIAITRGSDPTLFFDNGNIIEIPAQKIKAVDTLGAGDVFHGAFCYYYVANGGDIPLALEQAGKVAAHSCQYYGTREWMKSLDTL